MELSGTSAQEKILHAERRWLSSQISTVLHQTCKVLTALGQEVPQLEGDDQLGIFSSFRQVQEALAGVDNAWRVFESLLTDEIRASERALLSLLAEDVERVREERLKRRTVELVQEVAGGEEHVESLWSALVEMRMALRKEVEVVEEGSEMEEEEEEVVRQRRSKRERAPSRKAKEGTEVRVREKKKKQRQKPAQKKRSALRKKQKKDDTGEDEEDLVPMSRDEEEEDEDEIGILLNACRESALQVEAMLMNKGGETSPIFVSVPRDALLAPDISLSSAEHGGELLEDECKLNTCLSDEPEHGMAAAVERYGVLLRWWRVVRRSYALHGIFEHLKGRRGRRSMKDRFESAVKGSVSYGRATFYVRLAAFLLKYPRFVNQVHLVTVAGWFERIESGDRDGDDGVVLDRVEKRLDGVVLDRVRTFWEGHEEVVGGAEEEAAGTNVDQLLVRAENNPILDFMGLSHGPYDEIVMDSMGHLDGVSLVLEASVC